MTLRQIASAGLLPLMVAAAAIDRVEAAAAPAAAPAPTVAPAADPNAPAQPQFSVNQPFGDWAVRCALETVKSPAPCDLIQLTVNQDTKQRVMSFSLAFVPSRDSYALQLIVPIGVALSKGVTVAAGERSLENVKYAHCERDGCYVELLVDTPTVASLQAAGGTGKSTTVSIYSYGTAAANEIKLPVSLNGFPEALDRMRTLARQRAVALPASTVTPPTASGTPRAGTTPSTAATGAKGVPAPATPAPATPAAAGAKGR